MNNKTFLIVVSILILASIIGLMSYLPGRFDSSSGPKMSVFPINIGQWQGKDIPLSEKDYEILETRNLIMREYKNPRGESIYLYIIYSEGNRKVAHPPEICLTGGGLNILDKASIQLTPSIRAVKMLMEKGDFRQVVVYWYKAGDAYTDQYLKQQLKIALGNTMGKKISGAMIRVSTNVKDNDDKSALSLIQSFVSQIEPLLPKYVP